MTTNLKTIHGVNEFCGPGVLSALTGRSTDQCAAVISAVSGRHEIRAVSTAHLIEAFKRLRFDMTQINKRGYTLFANISAISREKGMYILMVPKHVVAVEVVDENHIFLIDNHSKSPVPAEGSARLSQKCEGLYKITEKPQPVYVRTEIQIVRDEYRATIKSVEIYENPEDNVNMNLGTFHYKDEMQFREIVRQLTGTFIHD